MEVHSIITQLPKHPHLKLEATEKDVIHEVVYKVDKGVVDIILISYKLGQ